MTECTELEDVLPDGKRCHDIDDVRDRWLGSGRCQSPFPWGQSFGVCGGVFGDRFAEIAEIYGANVTRLQVKWGTAVDPEEIRSALAADPSIKSVLVTHNETSTAVTNNLEAIAKIVKEHDKLLLVDAISSMGAWIFEMTTGVLMSSWLVHRRVG